jgi:hypothetical protein
MVSAELQAHLRPRHQCPQLRGSEEGQHGRQGRDHRVNRQVSMDTWGHGHVRAPAGGGTCKQEMQPQANARSKRNGAVPQGLGVKGTEKGSQMAGDKVQGTTGRANGAQRMPRLQQ